MLSTCLLLFGFPLGPRARGRRLLQPKVAIAELQAVRADEGGEALAADGELKLWRLT